MDKPEMREACVGEEFEVVEIDGKRYFKVPESNPPEFLKLNFSIKNIDLKRDDGDDFVLATDELFGRPLILLVTKNRMEPLDEQSFFQVLVPGRKFRITG